MVILISLRAVTLRAVEKFYEQSDRKFGAVSPRPGAAGHGADRRLRRGSRLRARARQVDDPPDHRAPGRRRTGGGAAVPAGDRRRESGAHVASIRTPGRGISTTRGASPRSRSKPFAACARRITSCSRSCPKRVRPDRQRIPSDGPVTLRNLLERVTPITPKATRGSCRRFATNSRKLRERNEKPRWIAAAGFAAVLFWRRRCRRDAKRWWSHIALSGRRQARRPETGSEGHRKAADVRGRASSSERARSRPGLPAISNR